MRTRLMYSLAIVFGLAVVADVQATWPRRDMGSGYYGGTAMYPTSPTYVSGTVIGGPVYATDMYTTGTVIERTGPFGLVRRRVIMATPTPVMPAPATVATTMPTMPGTIVTPASGTTVMPMPATPMVTPTATVIERTGPFGLFRRRVTMVSPTPVMPAPVIATPSTPMTTTPTPAVTPASGTTSTPMPATTTTTGVVTSGYVVPPAGTVTVVPAQYSFSRPFFRRGTYYSTPMPTMNGTTYYTPPGSVTTATYVVPESATGTYYPQYTTGRYFGFSGFGFRWR